MTAAEAEAGAYSVEHVVLPLPGHRVRLPELPEVCAVYESMLRAEGLDADSLRHKVKELALPGSYRPLVQRPLDMQYAVLQYDDPTAPLAPTDLTRMRGEPDPTGVAGGRLTAARLEFTLPPSTYATMCLRELTKQSTDLAHQLHLNAGAEAAADAAHAPATAARSAGHGAGATAETSQTASAVQLSAGGES